MSICREHNKIEVLFVVQRLAALTPAEVDKVLKTSAQLVKLLEVHTIFHVQVDVARRRIGCDFERLA
jgi:hypothetical protein